MAPFRKEKVASVVRDTISDAIARKLSDPRIAPFTTVSRVEITGDFAVATVYLTVQGEPADERRTIRAMRHASGFLQRFVAQALTMRQCPELRFQLDESAKIVRETLQLLAENRIERSEGGDDPPMEGDEPLSEEDQGSDE